MIWLSNFQIWARWDCLVRSLLTCLRLPCFVTLLLHPSRLRTQLTHARTKTKLRLVVLVRYSVFKFSNLGPVGLEPTTNWLRVNCATDCATHPNVFSFQIRCVAVVSEELRSSATFPLLERYLIVLVGRVPLRHITFSTNLYYHKILFCKILSNLVSQISPLQKFVLVT